MICITNYGDDIAGTLTARGDSSPCIDRGQNVVCMAQTQAHAEVDEDMCGTLTRRSYKDAPVLASEYVVRRLMPVECERLQGFPDGWTDIEFRGKPASDTARYKALGNSMAVPVMRWIGERIDRIEREGGGIMSDRNPNSPVGDITHICGTCSKSVPVFVSTESCDRHCRIDALFGVKNCPKWTERNSLAAYNADGTKITSFAGHALDDAYDMVIRYERLAQVATQMRDWLFYCIETDPGHVVVESDQDEVREIREAFDALGVSVDDVG